MLDVQIAKTLNAASAAPFKLDLRFKTGPGVLILFGASGAGKSLTLQLLAGLQTPDQGQHSSWRRSPLRQFTAAQSSVRLRRVGFVFQNLALFPHLNTRQKVAYGLAHLSAVERTAAR
jgi:molybdate transport system ATP-binding protein